MARVAIVTGAARGIGAATARALAADGFHVVCAARRADRIEALAEEMGGADKVARQHGRGKMDARVRLAALVDPGSFREIGKIAWYRLVDIVDGDDAMMMEEGSTL